MHKSEGVAELSWWNANKYNGSYFLLLLYYDDGLDSCNALFFIETQSA